MNNQPKFVSKNSIPSDGLLKILQRLGVISLEYFLCSQNASFNSGYNLYELFLLIGLMVYKIINFTLHFSIFFQLCRKSFFKSGLVKISKICFTFSIKNILIVIFQTNSKYIL